MTEWIAEGRRAGVLAAAVQGIAAGLQKVQKVQEVKKLQVVQEVQKVLAAVQ